METLQNIIAMLQHDRMCFAYAMRKHNYKNRDGGNRIIVQDLIEDWLNMDFQVPFERGVALIHLRLMVMATSILYKFFVHCRDRSLRRNDRDNLLTAIERCTQMIDLSKDVWTSGGYHITGAEQGYYNGIVERRAAFIIRRD